jgi:hypothetical protein
MQSNQDVEVCFLPGWMFGAEYYGFEDKTGLWQSSLNKIRPVSAKTLIGFSIGGHLAMKWFLEGRSERLILVNPVIRPRSIGALILCHLRYLLKDSAAGKLDWSGTLSFKYLPVALQSCFKIFGFNFWQMIEKCRPDKVAMVFGAEDDFFASDKAKQLLKEKGFKIIEVSYTGHHWSKEMRLEIQKLLN